MKNIINLILNRDHTCPWWLCFTFDNHLRKLIHDPVKLLSSYVNKGDTVLDLGPGMGYFTIPLCTMTTDNGMVYAADVQQRMLERITHKARKNNINHLATHLVEHDRLDLDVEFDFILAFWMFHEITNKTLMFEQLYAHLKETGKLLIVEPKIHVGRGYFEQEVALAKSADFVVIAYPQTSMSRSVLLTKQ